MEHCCMKNKINLPNKPCSKFPESRDETILGYPIQNFWLMPKETDYDLIIEAMFKIAIENQSLNGISTSFSGSPIECLGLPYMELLIPDNTGLYYVYSSTNADSYLFTTDSSNLEIENTNIVPNPFRFYMWNSTIFNLAVQPTDEFPAEKTFKFVNGNYKQKMELKATTTIGSGEPYSTSTVNRNTIYIYYPNSILYCIIDTNQNKIYVMQTGNNQKTGLNPLTPENMIFTQQLIKGSLPEGLIFTCTQLGPTDTVLVVSSPESPATLMQDSLGNSYQLATPEYAKILYDSLQI